MDDIGKGCRKGGVNSPPPKDAKVPPPPPPLGHSRSRERGRTLGKFIAATPDGPPVTIVSPDEESAQAVIDGAREGFAEERLRIALAAIEHIRERAAWLAVHTNERDTQNTAVIIEHICEAVQGDEGAIASLMVLGVDWQSDSRPGANNPGDPGRGNDDA